MSRNGQVAILPAGFAASRGWRLPTWDRMLLPGFFARIIVSFGEPMVIPKETEVEDLPQWQTKVNQAITDQCKIAAEKLTSQGCKSA